jgi:diacylglycerol kinase (ATP)
MSHLKNQPLAARLRHAWAGLCHAAGAERSLRTQLAVLCTVLVLLAYLRPAPLWWALVLLASSGVISAELLNTALERLADHLHPHAHAQIRIVKDCAAAAVLVAALGALCVGTALALELWRTH